ALVARVGEEAVVLAVAAAVQDLASLPQLAAEAGQHFDLGLEPADLSVEGVEGGRCGLLAGLRLELELEQRADLVERQSRGAHVGDELQPLELALAEQPMAAGAA